MAKIRNYEMDMTQGPIMSKLMRFTFPIILTSVLQLLFNAADTVVAGKFAGHVALAATGSVMPVIGLIINVFNGLSLGAGVIVARCYGSGVLKDIRDSVHTAITMAIACGVFCMVAGIAFCPQLLKLVGIPGDVMDAALLYTRIYFCGVPALVLYNFAAAILRSVGDTRRPLIFLTIAGVVNVLLNMFMVIVLHMGVAGVAVATVASQLISMVLVVRSLMLYEGSVKLEPKKLRINYRMCKEIAKIGLPAGLQGMIFSVSNVMIQSGINSFGSIAMAGNTAANSIEGFVFVAVNSVYQSAMTFTSQNMGARRYERITPIMLNSVVLAAGLGLVIGVSAYVFRRPLLGIYSNSPEVVELGMIRMKLNVLPYFIYGVMDVFTGMLRGLGYSLLPMFTTIVCICGVRLFAVLVVFPMAPSLYTLYASYPISWILTLIANCSLYFICKRKLNRRIAFSAENKKIP